MPMRPRKSLSLEPDLERRGAVKDQARQTKAPNGDLEGDLYAQRPEDEEGLAEDERPEPKKD
jgi:hypothetical protein